MNVIDGMVRNLIVQYFSVVEEIKKRKKKKLTPEERKAYLKRLLAPLLIFSNSFYKSDSTYNFIDESIWMEELPLARLIYDKEKYRIEPDPFNDKAYDPDRSAIYIYEDVRKYRAERAAKERTRLAHIEQLEREGAKVHDTLRYSPLNVNGGITSIRKLYEKWLPALTREVMMSKDLLDQVLVAFTIKRALNRDQAAIDKLYALYEDNAIGTAVNMAKARKLLHYAEEIKQEAKLLLLQIISGLEPKKIINSLVNDKPVPLSVEMFYFHYLSEYVPKKLTGMLNVPLPLDSFDAVGIRALLNVYSPIMHNTKFTKKKRTMMFNSFSFRPKKETNLTTWLFGTKINPMQGKFPQLLSDKILDQLARTHKEFGPPEDMIDRLNHQRKLGYKRKSPKRPE